jgi:hypothetical protein
MFRRALLVFLVCALLAPAAALAQGDAFGPLPQAAPTPAPTPAQDNSNNSLTSDLGGRTTLFVIMGGLLVAFIGIGVFISRDARRALPKDHRPDHRLRDEGPHKHKRQAKARARQRTKAQKVARRKNR